MRCSVQPKAKSALHEIWQAATCEDAERAFDQFIVTYEAKYPKATNCLLKDRESRRMIFRRCTGNIFERQIQSSRCHHPSPYKRMNRW